jgi:hypothetical protein
MAQVNFNVEEGKFTQQELCEAAGLDRGTVDTWIIRGVLHTTKVGGRIIRGRRLFSILAIFEAAVIGELVTSSAIGPSDGAKIAKCAAANWNTKDDWKPMVLRSVEASLPYKNVYLLARRFDGEWLTQDCFGDDKAGPEFKPMRSYQELLNHSFVVVPASYILARVYLACNKMLPASSESNQRRNQ